MSFQLIVCSLQILFLKAVQCVGSITVSRYNTQLIFICSIFNLLPLVVPPFSCHVVPLFGPSCDYLYQEYEWCSTSKKFKQYRRRKQLSSACVACFTLSCFGYKGGVRWEPIQNEWKIERGDRG